MSSRRLYLFDIDGTLISTGGAGSSAMRAAFTALWHLEDGFRNVEFSGRTDRAIFRDATVAAGFDEAAFGDNLGRFKRAYYRRLGGALREHDGTVLPGVQKLLDELKADDGATIGLGTGNFRVSAGMKLDYYGIGHYFSQGGFGDRTEDRAIMIAQGIRSVQRHTGRHLEVFVIGDTVHDIKAAKDNGVIAVGVATGTNSQEMLSDAGADIVLATLESAADELLPNRV